MLMEVFFKYELIFRFLIMQSNFFGFELVLSRTILFNRNAAFAYQFIICYLLATLS